MATMDNEQILQSIKEDLKKEGLDCLIQTFDPALPPKLLIYTGTDKENRTQLIEIKAHHAEINPTKGPSNTFISLQLDAFFPFVIDDMALTDVAQFLHFLNLQVEVPGFYLNQLDNTVLYRYVLLSENGLVPKKILMSLIGISMFFQDVFGQTLARLGKGQVTFIDLMQEIQEVLEKAAEESSK